MTFRPHGILQIAAALKMSVRAKRVPNNDFTSDGVYFHMIEQAMYVAQEIRILEHRLCRRGSKKKENNTGKRRKM